MDHHRRRCDDGMARQALCVAGQLEGSVMSIPHGPIDLLLAAALSLLVAALAAGQVFA